LERGGTLGVQRGQGMITDIEIQRVLTWERNWFRRASMGELVRREEREATTAGASRFIAMRILRHAVWYLRVRSKKGREDKAVELLRWCLRKIKAEKG